MAKLSVVITDEQLRALKRWQLDNPGVKFQDRLRAAVIGIMGSSQTALVAAHVDEESREVINSLSHTAQYAPRVAKALRSLITVIASECNHETAVHGENAIENARRYIATDRGNRAVKKGA